jgi:four helix bundle protein
MNRTEPASFNEFFREKTAANAQRVFKLYKELKRIEELKVIGKQVLRSATSVAANFRSVCRARSAAEHFAKLCIVVEECDETLFWLEFLELTGDVKCQLLMECKTETKILLMALAKARRKLKPQGNK